MYHCVAAWAAEDPTAVAIRGPDRLTSADLVARADGIARCLWQVGLRPGDRAGLLLGRSSDAVAAILAIARIGAAYVPIDPSLPPALQQRILSDAAARVLVAVADNGAGVPLLRLDQALPSAAELPPLPPTDPAAAAYVMYTSGSTGVPKGVVVPWRGVLRLVQDPDYVTFAPTDVILHAAPLGFDASTFEIWGALLNRAALAILPDAVPSLDAIAEALERYGVTIAWLTSGLFHAMVDARLPALAGVRQLLAGGDVLSPPHVARALAALPNTTLINGYGPTENTTFTCCYPIPSDHPADMPVPIGWPIRGTSVWLLDEAGRPVADGEEGELCTGGDGVALGYLNRPEATAAAFVTGPDGKPIYRTGDRARRRPDGAVIFAGRKDREVKIRGKRVCLDDVEAAILLDPAVREAAVVFKAGRADAFITGDVEAAALRRSLLARLPEHMVPSVITVLGAMPLTRNGKLDRKALPAASATAEGLQQVWRSVLGREFGEDTNLFDAGVSSLDIVRAHAAMTDAGFAVTLTDLFAFPSIVALAAHLDGADGPPAEVSRGSGGDIAIIGMAARFPGASDLDAFWDNLCNGVESITRFPLSDLQDAASSATRADPVAARPVLDGIDHFDPTFFAMSRREAELTDPQHRVFLEIAWEALETAGHDPAAYNGRIGVFAGSSPNSYLLRNVLADRSAVLRYTSDYQTGSYQTLLGAGSDFLATRVAYKLDLRGPALTVVTACSTSLVAVAQACAALRAGETDMALAGGVSITLPQQRGYLHEPGGLASADGHVRPFDAAASGTVFGSGAAVVLLKRMADAVAEGDHIHAVIRGAATNNDGASKVGFTAPSVSGQAACITAAHAQAGIAPETIGYVEAHGTATPLGDPIEVAALRQAWGTAAQPGQCVLGSVKGNIGHLDAASGCAGLIKATLAVERATIPPTLHFQTPNPAMQLDTSPFRVSAQTERWNAASLRRAGVSSFGVGGTNAHAVIEQAPSRAASTEPGTQQVLLLSARSPAGLAEARNRLANHIEHHPEQSLANIAWTLQTARRRFKHRAAVVCSNHCDAITGLRADRVSTAEAAANAGGVVFMFPGQGAQYPGMGRALYDSEPVYRASIDRCATILQPYLGFDLRHMLFSDGCDETAAETLMNTAVAQPAIFATSYATAQVWLTRGLNPVAMLGHSVGEFVAACLAGVFTIEDALSLVAARGRMMGAMGTGAMLSVRLPEAELLPLLGDELDLAAANGPSLSVAAGPASEIARLEQVLQAREVPCRRLHTSHAFHSRAMNAVSHALLDAVSAVSLSAPAIPVVSSVSGDWLTEAQATSPAYWAAHCRVPVRFGAGVETLRQAAIPLAALLECGPGRGLVQLALAGGWRNSASAAIPSLPEAESGKTADQTVADAVASLWLAGVELDWTALDPAHPGRRRVPLPPTPWEKTRCWIDEPEPFQTPEPQQTMVQTASKSSGAAETALPELMGLFEELSGEKLNGVDPATSFLQLGFDSLFLGQIAQQIRSRLGVKITFRQLLGDCGTFVALSKYVEAERPMKAATVTPTPSPAPSAPVAVTAAPSQSVPHGAATLMQQQVQAMSALFAQQLATFASGPVVDAPAPVLVAATAPENTTRFDAFKVVSGTGGGLTAAGLAHVKDLTASTVARTGNSKRLTASARTALADPRAAAGFRPEWKEMTYPIVAVRSAGPHIWDADGNKYVDLVNGFGQTAFGHAPPFVVEAVKRQLDKGFEIGPQAELAGEVAARFCAMTGNERMTYCNTGSEAGMAAMRIARTVTGRSRIVTFAGSYHGQFDEVLVKAGPKGARPVAPGIPQESVSNITVLEYGQAASLDWIRQHADELAAVLVEPVQSRHPALQPRSFLKELRDITQQSGTCLVFDEVVTGFRTHPGGMQAIFDIRADLVTYGKVVGGGLPIGVLAGKAAFMDALDGGAWNYGDDSVPEAAVTFFAGTFVRHPLALAAMNAILTHVAEAGPAIYAKLASLTTELAGRLNTTLAAYGLPQCVEHYASWFYFKLSDPLASLIYPHMRLRGVHIQEGFPCFLTTTHGQAEVDTIAGSFEQSLAALQTAAILSSSQSTTPLIPQASTLEAPLTEAQVEIWLAAQLGDAASCAFNEGLSIELLGPLDITTLTKQLDRVLSRHDALRSRFAADGTKMVIGEWQPLALNVEDEALDRVLEQEAQTPLDLVQGPPFRLRLVRSSQDRHVLILTVHHIVCDGWSINVLLGELAQEGDLPVSLSFAAYAKEQRAAANREDIKWWIGKFTSQPTALTLPTDRPRPTLRSFAGGTRKSHLDIARVQQLKKAGAAQGCTLFTTLLTAFSIFVGRLSDQKDLVVAIPAAGQSQADIDNLVGHCVNLLPIRASWTGDLPFSGALGRLNQTVLEAYEHQSCTLGTLVRELGITRDTGRLPLADVQFNLERLSDKLQVCGLAASAHSNRKAFVNFDLFLNAVESETGITLECDYNADLFDPETVDRWLAHFSILLDAIAKDASTSVAALPLLSDEERDNLLRLNGTALAVPDVPVHRLVEAQAVRRPDAIAVRQGRQTMTYKELDQRANQIAHVLLTRTVPGSRVAVMMDRTPDVVAVLLASWKAGLTYVPLDPAHPVSRLSHIVSDAEIALLITDGTGPLLDSPILNLAENASTVTRAPNTPPTISDDVRAPAYIIYTSGSTGLPKGVIVGHHALANLLLSMGQEPGITQDDVWLAVTTISFDIAGLELFGPLLAGAQVALASREELTDGHRLIGSLAETRATILQATPATWRLLLEAGFRSGSLKMLCGGEPLQRTLADQLLADGGELWNMYGPTETTIWSALERVATGPITIGHPVANTSLYVLNTSDQLQPIGVPGELHIGGIGLAEGYRNRPDLTTVRFIANGFTQEGRLYRTGDLARRLPDGRVQILGRMDGQIKLRGYRIEPGEIEHVLTAFCRFSAAVVGLQQPPGADPRLVAWVVLAHGDHLDERETRRVLRSHVPDYMVPAVITQIASLPVTPNGKIDRQGLSKIAQPVSAVLEPGETDLEQRIIDIWSDVLKYPVGRSTDLILIGADSIQIFQITSRLRACGLAIQAKDLLKHRTPAKLAAFAGTISVETPATPRLAEFRRDRNLMFAGK